MKSSVSILTGLAKNNLWSNHRLHCACEQLSNDDYRAPRPAYFGSIHNTLNHILIVDLLYLGRLTNQQLVPLDCEEIEPELVDLIKIQRQTDYQLIEFNQSLSHDELQADILFKRANGQSYRERVIKVLMHLFIHQIHHRGQVHDMLSQTPVPPPQLDEFFLTGDLKLREKEIDRLGI